MLQLRANGLSRDGRKFCNGELVTVRSFKPDGSIGVADRDGGDLCLWPDQRVLQPGYAVTSFGSQGKTVDAVLLADAGVAAASHQKEWYVSISRARRSIAVYAPGIAGLASRIAATGERLLRTPWQDFPNVAVHTNMRAMKAHPAYPEAKSGDTKAARFLIKSFFKPGALATVAGSSVDYVVPVMQLDVSERWNVLPLEFARSAAQTLKARILPLIVQDNAVHHTGADSLDRLVDQPSFTGTVLPGTYLIVDDVVTLGSTLANLRGWSPYGDFVEDQDDALDRIDEWRQGR